MADGARIPDQQLLAVFRRPEDAEEAGRRLAALGVDRSQLAVGQTADEVTSLRAEMRDEATEGWILPQAAVALPKEGAKGMALIVVVASLVAALIAAPFAFIDFGLTFAGRLVLLVLIGIALGGTVGIVMGPALASKRPAEPLAAQRGVVMRIPADSDEIRGVLAELHPIRVDELKGRVPMGTVTTDEDRSRGSTLHHLEDNAAGDDFESGDAGNGPTRP